MKVTTRPSRFRRLAAGAVAVALVAAACGGDDDDDDAAGATTAEGTTAAEATAPTEGTTAETATEGTTAESAPPTTPPPVETVFGGGEATGDEAVVRWYVGLGTGAQPEQLAAQRDVVEDFNESHEGEIQLEVEIVDNEIAFDNLSTQIAGGNAPDIIGPIGIRGSNAFAGQFLDLEPLVESTGLRPVAVRPGAGRVLA